VPTFNTLIEKSILQEDSELAQLGIMPFLDRAPNSFTEHPDMLLVNELGETVYKLQTASHRKHNVVLRMRQCEYCKQQHVETLSDCPFMYIAMQLVFHDGNLEENPAVMHLSTMFHCLVPIIKPMVQCYYCENVHTKGECPFMIVSK
jgi:hypothetical protein